MDTNETVSVNKKEPGYFMMNMPEWFINLPDEEKIRLAKKFSEDSPDGKFLTPEELVEFVMGPE